MPRGNKFEIEPERLYALAREGKTHNQIAEALGLAQSTLTTRMKKEPALYETYRRGYEEAQRAKGREPKWQGHKATSHSRSYYEPMPYEVALLAGMEGRRGWAERMLDLDRRAVAHAQRARADRRLVARALRGTGGLSRREIREATELDYSRVNDALDGLRERGRVERLADRNLIEFYGLLARQSSHPKEEASGLRL